jgi:hypothetical protein
MLLYAKTNLAKEGKFEVMINDHDVHFQEIASQLGLVATPNKEFDAIFHIDQTPTDYTLPEGFSIISMKDRLDLYQYGRVLWKGLITSSMVKVSLFSPKKSVRLLKMR